MLINAWIVMGKTVHAVRSCSRLAENPLGANNTVVVVAIIYLGFAGIVLFFFCRSRVSYVKLSRGNNLYTFTFVVDS